MRWRTVIDVARLLQLLARALPDVLLDPLDDPLGLILAAVDEQPARALGHVPPHEQDREGEHRAEPEGQAPAEVGREEAGVEQEDRGDGTARGTEPVGAVDDEVHAAAHASRDQLVDGRVDRRVLAADAGAGDEAAGVEVEGALRERRRDRRYEVHDEREQEQPLTPESVRELPEEQRAQAGARHVDRSRGEHLALAEREPALLAREPRGDRADDRDLEAVEDPHGSQPDDHHPVEARPRQAVQPGRHLRLDGPELHAVARHARRVTPARGLAKPGG